MKYKKGQSGNPKGRPKGAKDKFTSSLKDEFLQAFHDEDGIGGGEGIKELMKDNKKIKLIFLQLISKMLPSSIDMKVDVPPSYSIPEKAVPKKEVKK